jgi:hypothetical protein
MENLMVHISGWGIPRPLYDVVKATARATGEIQAVGTCYAVPRELLPDPNDHQGNWDRMLERSAANAARQRQGIGVSYIIGMTAEQLRELGNHREGIKLGMIMHISPHGD